MGNKKASIRVWPPWRLPEFWENPSYYPSPHLFKFGWGFGDFWIFNFFKL